MGPLTLGEGNKVADVVEKWLEQVKSIKQYWGDYKLISACKVAVLRLIMGMRGEEFKGIESHATEMEDPEQKFENLLHDLPSWPNKRKFELTARVNHDQAKSKQWTKGGMRAGVGVSPERSTGTSKNSEGKGKGRFVMIDVRSDVLRATVHVLDNLRWR